jgi:hypothetical protein
MNQPRRESKSHASISSCLSHFLAPPDGKNYQPRKGQQDRERAHRGKSLESLLTALDCSERRGRGRTRESPGFFLGDAATTTSVDRAGPSSSGAARPGSARRGGGGRTQPESMPTPLKASPERRTSRRRNRRSDFVIFVVGSGNRDGA